MIPGKATTHDWPQAQKSETGSCIASRQLLADRFLNGWPCALAFSRFDFHLVARARIKTASPA
jgi:hypothetical protein